MDAISQKQFDEAMGHLSRLPVPDGSGEVILKIRTRKGGGEPHVSASFLPLAAEPAERGDMGEK